MKKVKKLLTLSLAAVGSISLTSCNLFKKKDKNNNDDVVTDAFDFSIGLRSGASIIEVGSSRQEFVDVYDNGINTANRSYEFSSTNPSVATIGSDGKITAVAPGRVNFIATEKASGNSHSLKREIVVEGAATPATGGFNFSAESVANRKKILGKLEKNVMDSHLTGITLFDNGGLVAYSNRVKSPTDWNYVVGYGFGVLSEGTLEGTLEGTDGGSNKHPTYYHSAMGQDGKKINQYTATGSVVSDLASYITSTYWSTKLKDKTSYEWYPSLAADQIKKPTFDASGAVTGYGSLVKNEHPVPHEPVNETGLYKKWRIYLKNPGDFKYTTKSSVLSSFNNRAVSIDDYEFIYKLLFTGSNNIIRGTEMANDTSYGIKGAQRFFNETKTVTDIAEIDEKWNRFKEDGLLGIGTGYDSTNALYYLDLELINPIDEFTAMYTLSSSLVSPLPRDLFVGGPIDTSMQKAIKYYGTFGNSTENILDCTLCFGPFTLSSWVKDTEVVFERNEDWYEVKSGERYHIPGIYYRVMDTSTDSEKHWKHFKNGNLDSAGVPSSKVDEQRGQPYVHETKGDSTFKLNVNSCTEAQWNKLFGESGRSWNLKPWMANADFVDGLFYSIDRKSFAERRGMTPTINYFSDAYLIDPQNGVSWNSTDEHKEAVKGYSENYGYDLNKAIECFRAAVKQLEKSNSIVLGTKENPTNISIHIRWMYRTDINEYGNEIKSYFETAFNDEAVCGGKVRLNVEQEAVEQWEQVYNEYLMTGCFDLGFGAISGNTYNPLNFLEVLKSDNSSSFTLNWGPDTAKVDSKNPIIYNNQRYSFDGLWEVADHGGIVKDGEKVKALNSCVLGDYSTNDLYEGFTIEIPVDFAEYGNVEFNINRLDVYVFGHGNITVAERAAGDDIVYDKENKVIRATITPDKATSVDTAVKDASGYKADDANLKNNRFTMGKLGALWDFEVYYEMKIGDSSASVIYAPVTVE